MKLAGLPLLPRFLCIALLVLCAGVLRAQSSLPAPLFGPGERILFIGDSITDMNRGRSEDPNHILGHSYVFLIATRHGATYPERQLVFINRGVSGNTVADLEKRWKPDVLDLKPDVLSVLVGINDIYFSLKNATPLQFDEIEARYDRLLSSAREQNPSLRLVLGEPFMLPGRNTKDNWEAWHEPLLKLQAMVARLAEKHQAVLVHYQKLFDEALQRAPVGTWIWDGIHPTYSGQQLMATEWQRAYEARFFPASPSSGDNTALIPVPKLEQDSYDWYARHLQVLELQKSLSAEVVLIGDSITHFWAGEPLSHRRNGPKAWDSVFAGKKVLNLGFGWDRTQNVLWRLDQGEFNGQSPRLIVLNLGTNNLTGTKNARTNTPEEIAAGIRLICQKLHALSPGSRILVMGVFPRGFEVDAVLLAPIKALNALLPQVLKDCPQVTFLDIGKQLVEPNGTMTADIMFDSTHPGEKGYAIWAQAIRDSGLLDAAK